MKFNFPKKSELIFFDVVDEIILKIFKNDKKLIIKLRTLKKNLNFFILLKILLSFQLIKILIKDGFLVAYVCSYIKYSNAKKVITCIDNNTRFYMLKHYFRNIKFISIQNGSRHKFMDIFGSPDLKKALQCDEILVFGNSIKKKYMEHIKASVKTVGCFRSNNFNIFKLKKKNTILFISQFRSFSEDKIMNHFGKDVTTWGKMNLNLNELLPNILNYCGKNNLQFGILSTTGSKNEFEYFRKILGLKTYWKFHRPKNRRDSYKLLDMSEIIVNVWSTMGLESLSRGNKTCFFRQKDFGYNDRHFGWPKKYIGTNFFCSNNYDYLSVSRILSQMRLVNLNDWKKLVNKYTKDNLIYNFQNKKLINLVKE